jgi:hypothetical protein
MGKWNGVAVSELVLLKELEEVPNFQAAVFGHVRAVDHISHSVQAEFRSKENN